jgi:GTPase SAR1 family protein
MLQGTKVILELYDNDEFKPFIVIGDHSVGKSAYAESLIADVYGHVFNSGVPLWNNFTPRVQEWFALHLGFQPRHVLDEWQFTDKREKWLLDEFGEYPRKVFNNWQYADILSYKC